MITPSFISKSDATLTHTKPAVTVVTFAMVVALHGLVVAGLMALPTPTIKPPAPTVPLEISFAPPPQPAPKPVNTESVVQSQPTQTNANARIDSTSTPKREQVTKPKVQQPNEQTKAKKSLTPKIESKPPVQQPPIAKAEKPVATVKPALPKTIVSAKPSTEPSVMVSPQVNQAKVEQAQALKAPAQQAAQKAAQEQAARVEAAQQAAQEKAAQEARTRQQVEQARQAEAAAAQAAKQSRDRSRETATAEAKRVEPSEPIRFSNGDAQWRTKPNLSFSGNLARIIEMENLSSIGVRINVSTSGQVTSVSVTRSSGNAQIDSAVAQRLLAAKLKPFIRDGAAVAGIGNLTIQLN